MRYVAAGASLYGRRLFRPDYRHEAQQLRSRAMTVSSQLRADAFRVERNRRQGLVAHEQAQGRVRAALAQQGEWWLHMHHCSCRSATGFDIVGASE